MDLNVGLENGDQKCGVENEGVKWVTEFQIHLVTTVIHVVEQTHVLLKPVMKDK